LGLGFPNRLDHFFDVATEYFDKFLFPYIEKNLNKNDVIVLLGDLFDNRDVVPINVLNYGQMILERMSKTCPVHVLIGNHDIFNKSSNNVNSVKPFDYIPDVTVYETPTKFLFNKKSILMLPWVEHKDEQVKILKQYSGCDYLFCHSDLNGARMHLTSVANRNKNKIDVDDFSGYKHVYSGHIHLVQRNKNFTFVGSIHEMDRNDYTNQKGVFLLNTEDGTEEFIPNTVSPKFKKVYLYKEEDLEQIEIKSNDWIDLFISNSLLINNRKMRRRLEAILKDGGFESVDYIDDITVKTEDGEDIVNEELESDLETKPISLNIDFEEHIIKYIKDQKWESDKIKEGILFEFDEIINIYKETN
jgi:DNA repair exonuclease SbcCD nuclease subunit